MRRLLRQVFLGFCCASPLAAQTNDPIFADWRWNPDSIGSRPAGMGGAFVAIADSGKSAYVNPAGLTLIPVKELGLSSGRLWMSAAAGGQKLRLAAYYTKTRDSRAEWDETGPRGAANGFLDSSAWEAGLAVGSQPLPRFRVGASVAWNRLSLDGEDARSEVEGQIRGTTVRGESGHMRLAAGLLFDLVGQARIQGEF